MNEGIVNTKPNLATVTVFRILSSTIFFLLLQARVRGGSARTINTLMCNVNSCLTGELTTTS